MYACSCSGDSVQKPPGMLVVMQAPEAFEACSDTIQLVADSGRRLPREDSIELPRPQQEVPAWWESGDKNP